jgi:hypothetical protein
MSCWKKDFGYGEIGKGSLEVCAVAHNSKEQKKESSALPKARV